jgi:hypothetical protein
MCYTVRMVEVKACAGGLGGHAGAGRDIPAHAGIPISMTGGALLSLLRAKALQDAMVQPHLLPPKPFGLSRDSPLPPQIAV